MIEVMEFIASHYIWFLVGAIVTLLAIIGYYADKTNFGQGNSLEDENNPEVNLDNVGLSDIANGVYENNEDTQKDSPIIVDNNEFMNNELDLAQMVPDENFVSSNIEEPEGTKILTEEEINKFNDEFNSILPKKDFIDTGLLSDIENLELDKTQKINIEEVPDLDDVELPKIKKMNVEEDIWKF